MSILYALNTRCISRYKCCSLMPMVNRLSSLQPPVKTVLPNKQIFLTSSRHFSWDGFYYSLSFSAPVMTLQSVLLDFHNFSGLPWWTVIMLTTLGIRSIFVFPLTVHQHQVIARLSNINRELGKMAPQMTKEVNIAAKLYGLDELSATKVFRRNMRNYYKKFILRDNCHPFKIFLLAVFQIPVWICLSVSLRNLTMNAAAVHYDPQLLQQQFQTEGALWFTDLTSPDSYIIPVLLAFVNLANIEIHALRQLRESGKFQKGLLYMMRAVSILVAGAATLNPSSVTFYWLCSSTFGLVQNVVLMSPRFRHVLRIPRTANESSTPYKDIASNFRKRFLS